MPRKVPFSAKQKRAQLQAKKQKKQGENEDFQQDRHCKLLWDKGT